MVTKSDMVKSMAIEIGVDLCGIAPISRFDEAPKGYHPNDVLDGCKSVIVVACEFPKESLNADYKVYTLARNQMTEKMNTIVSLLSKKLESVGIVAKPKWSMGPCKWDENNRYRDVISLKHAGFLAGLGKIGKNTLLINEKYGNMIWLAAVLTTFKLEPDPLASYDVCPPGCKLCIQACPSNALTSELMEQLTCYNHAYTNESGEEEILCWLCREVCPNHLGL